MEVFAMSQILTVDDFQKIAVFAAELRAVDFVSIFQDEYTGIQLWQKHANQMSFDLFSTWFHLSPAQQKLLINAYNHYIDNTQTQE